MTYERSNDQKPTGPEKLREIKERAANIWNGAFPASQIIPDADIEWLISQLEASWEREKISSEALRTCYGWFNARVPEHREYKMLDVCREALEKMK